MFFTRNITFRLEQALAHSPVILLTGARQSGKTTLIKQVGQEKSYSYVTFDDLRFLSAAKNDPIGFIEGLQKPVILDEVQRVPEIFLPIKQDVDNNKNPGRYVLTGSANPLLIPRVSDSLAGRMEIINLFPLSMGEVLSKKDAFIDLIFSKTMTSFKYDKFSKQQLCQALVIGGYPNVRGIPDERRESWFNSYITTILERDVQDLANIEGLHNLPHLLHILATRVGSLLNSAELARTSGLSTTTLHRYVTLLKTLFLVDFQAAWSSNLSKRLVKSPKTYLIDPGLLSFLIGVNQEKLFTDSNLIGKVLENFVITELIKQATWNDTRTKNFHFRTSNGFEVDAILEDYSGNIVGIEIKSSETITPNDFKGLKHLQEIVGDKFIRGVVIYPGAEQIPFGKNLFALPISSLWATKPSSH